MAHKYTFQRKRLNNEKRLSKRNNENVRENQTMYNEIFFAGSL